MARVSEIETNGGVIYWVEKDELGVILARTRAPAEQQTVKTRRAAELREMCDDWRRWEATRTRVAALTAGEWTSLKTAASLPGTQAAAVSALTTQEQGAFVAYATALGEWMTA